jgi:L-threonylcarbamoyladenylate synthase
MTILKPTVENVAKAAEAILDGELVGMPTETVYGVASDATNREAVLKTFLVKNRPADNPLIVHIAHLHQVDALTTDFSAEAQLLAERFWPGPLTLILPKRPEIPGEVTGGRPTVAIRIPNHPVALRLIDQAGVPIAAPSANMFMGLSPTRAEHLNPDLGDRLKFILDGGACDIGLESSVVDLSSDTPKLLRPGGVARSELEQALGRSLGSPEPGERNSPGMYPRHYAPKTPVRLVDELHLGDAGITFMDPWPNQIQLPSNPRAYAISFYASLHRLDAEGHQEILIESPPRESAWEAVWDRLQRVVG